MTEVNDVNRSECQKYFCAVAKECGGCPGLLEGEYRIHCLGKSERLTMALAALGLESLSPNIRPSPNPIEYRRRIRLRCVNGSVRFFNSNKSSDCMVLTRSLRSLIAALSQKSISNPSLFQSVTHLDVREADLDGRFGLMVYGATKAQRCDIEAHFPTALVGIDDGTCPPMQRLHLVRDLSHFVPVNAFLQINQSVNVEILGKLEELCGEYQIRSFWDLFCGVGNLSLPLLQKGLKGGGIERDIQAVKAANRSAQQWQRDPCYKNLDARDLGAVPEFLPDLLILNPPRAGLRHGSKVIEEVGAKNLFLMSCSLETLADDLDTIMGLGYDIIRVEGFDMFPFTDHLEVTAFARRR